MQPSTAQGVVITPRVYALSSTYQSLATFLLALGKPAVSEDTWFRVKCLNQKSLLFPVTPMVCCFCTTANLKTT